MGFLIRTIEMFLVSAAPSAISLWLTLYRVNSDSPAAWRFMCMGSFVICVLGNIYYWRSYIISTGNDKKAFYLANLTAYAVYAAGVPILTAFADNEVFCAVYGALRGFELFNLPTVLSNIISLVILFVCMILTKVIVGKHVDLDIAMQREALEADEDLD